MKLFGFLCAAAVIAVPTTAMARTKTISGQVGDFSFEASNLIVGVTSTATAGGGGNPTYFANAPVYRGVVTLIMEYSSGAFICTGSAVAGNKIVTAAHCVSDGFGTAGPLRTRAYFTDSVDPDLVRFGAGFNPVAGVTALDVSHIHVNPGYTGQVIDQNDIAVLSLAGTIPVYAPIYDFFGGNPIANLFNVVGNGARSDTGGSIGANLGTGRMRQGDNLFDFVWGSPQFGGFFTDTDFWGTADYAFSLVSDFDSGLAANDVGGALSAFFPGQVANLGVGAREVSVAGGDSGGPAFINGRIAAITSYGAKFGNPNTDVDAFLNSSFGEMNGYVPVRIHGDWLKSVVPEPATWAMMIAGFGLVGAVARRRRQTVVAA